MSTQAAQWARGLPLGLVAFNVPARRIAANQYSKKYRFPDGSCVSVRPRYGHWRWGFFTNNLEVYR